MSLMKRRSVLKVVAAAPVTAIFLPAQQSGSPDERFTIELSAPDVAGTARERFFTADQFATLSALAGLIAPSIEGRPGATEAEVPHFLDFILSKSPRDRQELYQQGLNTLERGARASYRKSFGQLQPAQAEALLAPLRKPWTYQTPSDLQTRFLREAKADILRATTNSRAVALANASSRRRASGLNTYWHLVD